MRAHRGVGPLVIIGGAEDRQQECKILREFARLTGGARARVVIMTVASEYPDEVGAELLETFQRLGVRQVQVLDVRIREQAHEEKAIEVIERATGVFFTGGDQLRVTNLLGGTPIDQVLHRRHEEGLVLGGTSAGASMMASTMIITGLSDATPRMATVRVGPGMDFMRGTIIDQHFGQRGRIGRLLAALAQYPSQLGIGIDENTALIVQGDQLRVVGDNAVTILDAGGTTYNDVLERAEDEHIAICGVKLHILTAGLGFNLQDRTPIIPESRPGVRRNERRTHEDSEDTSIAGA